MGLLTTYSAYADATTYSASSPIELKLGLGYRWEATFLSRQKHPSWGFELYASADLGRFSSMKLHSVDVSLDADIAPKRKAVHATFDLGFAVYWGL